MSTKRELKQRVRDLEGRLRLETAYAENLTKENKRQRKAIRNMRNKEADLVRKGLVPDEVTTNGMIDIFKVHDYCNCPCKGTS